MIEARYINHMGDDMTVVDAARVSFAKGHGQYTEEANLAKAVDGMQRAKTVHQITHCHAAINATLAELKGDKT